MEIKTASHQNRLDSFLGLIGLFLIGLCLAGGILFLGGARPWIWYPILFTLLVVGLIQLSRLTRQSQWEWDMVDASVGLFLLYATVRYFTSPSEFLARQEWMNIFAYCLVFWTGRYGIARAKYGAWILGELTLLALISALFAFYLSHHLDWRPFGPEEDLHVHYAPRLIGTYGCPNHFGAMEVMAVGSALSLAFFAVRSWSLRLVIVYVCLVLVAAILGSMSRGSLLGLTAALLAFFILICKRRSLSWIWPASFGVVGLGSLLAAVVFWPGLWTRVSSLGLLAKGDIDMDVRGQLIRDALRIIYDHPWFGTGMATFAYVHPHYANQSYNTRAVYTHNDYLNLLADYGSVGGMIVLIFLILVSYRLVIRFNSKGSERDRALHGAGLCAWCALMIHSLTDFNLHIPVNALLFFTLVGLSLRDGHTHESRMRWQLPRIIGLLLVMPLLAGFGYLVIRTGIGYYFSQQTRSHQDYAPSSVLIRETEQALQWDSGAPDTLNLLGDIHRVEAGYAKDIPTRMKEGTAALDAYQQAFKANPLNDTVWMRMGLAYDAMYRFNEAFLSYQKAIAGQPYNPFFYNALGDHFRRRGLWDKANEAYQSALKKAFWTPDAQIETQKALHDLAEERQRKTSAPVAAPHETMP